MASAPTIDDLNALHGTRFHAAGTYAGGEVGAQRLIDEHGNAFVLKYQAPGLAPLTTEALRPLGYPVPRYVIATDVYSIQEELPGRPLGGWGMPLPARLLALNELQAGRSVDDDRSWPGVIVASVTQGFDEYMVLATLAEHSPESHELLELCQRAVDRNAAQITTTDDVVHYDFTPANVLAHDGVVTGIIDWGGTRSGDRTFDLATWLFYSRDDAELRRVVVERIGERGLSVYLAHMAIRQADWSLRHHREEAGWEMVTYGLELARAFP